MQAKRVTEMANQHTIQATGRKDEGKGASRRLRHAGLVPAIVYGGKSAPASIQLEHEKTWLASQNEWFYSSILDLEVDGKVQSVLLRDIQRHPFKQRIMHIDFQRVDAKTRLHMKVPLHYVKAEESQAVKFDNCVVNPVMSEIDISCFPSDLPEFIEVDLSGLKKGMSLHLNDITLPKGVTAVTRGKPNPVLVSVVLVGGEDAGAGAAEGVEAAPAAAAPAAEAKPAAKGDGKAAAKAPKAAAKK